MELSLFDRRLAGGKLIGLLVVVGLTLSMMFGVWQLIGLRKEVNVALDELHDAQSDNRTWTIAQTETDLMRYRLALAQTRVKPSPEAIALLRRQFDIFFSRVMTIHAALQTEHLLDAPDLFNTWEGVVQMTRKSAQVFDAGDAEIGRRLPQMEAAAEQATPLVRVIVVKVLQHITDDSLELREGTHDLLDSFFSWSAVMIGLLIALAAGVLMALYGLSRYARLKTLLSARQTTVINASFNSVLICDASGNIVEFNRTAEQMFQLDRDNEGPQRLDRLFVPGQPGHGGEDGDNAPPPIMHWLDLATASATVTSLVLRPDGTTTPVECVFAVDTEIDGRTIFIVFVRDISKQIDNELRLKAARDAAEQGERAKSRFLAVMSHEMRTPLNGLIAALEILRQTTRLSQRQQKFLTIAEQCGKTTLEQIDDVLELIRLDSGAPTDEVQSFDLPALLGSLVEQYRPMAALQHDIIEIEVPDEPSLCVVGPRRTLARIVLNLLGNAIKFTRAGKIRLCLQADMSQEDVVSLELNVSDTGRGITPEKLDVIFRDFETDALPGQPVAQGTGLGLGIVRRAIDRLGGTVEVTSTLGVGSTFTVRFSLPRGTTRDAEAGAKLKMAAPRSDVGQKPRELTVLVAEDNEINRQVLSEMLRHEGARVELARDGEEAVLMAGNMRYDLVIMDMFMPKLDGIEATRLIRSGGASAKSCIVGLTANAAGDQLDKMQAAGMAAAMSKPVTFEKLRNLLSKVEEENTDTAGSVAGGLIEVTVLRELTQSFTSDQLRDLLRRFEDEIDQALRTMETDRKDPDTPHRLAGTAAIFGAKAFRKLLIESENTIRAGETVPPARLRELRDCWQETKAHLLDWMEDTVARAAVQAPPKADML